jgi:TonB family protein
MHVALRQSLTVTAVVTLGGSLVAAASMLLCAPAAAAPASAEAPPPPGPPTTVRSIEVRPLPSSKSEAPAATLDMKTDENAVGVFVSVWPQAAYEARVGGKVTLQCRIDTHGLAEACEVLLESPRGKGFGQAALMLRPTFKFAPLQGPDGRPVESLMKVAVEFRPPDPRFDFYGVPPQGEAVADCGGVGAPCPEWRVVGNALPRRAVTMVSNPRWVEAATFEDVAGVYPSQGAGVEGYVVLHCAVERDGRVLGCQVIKEDPEGRGFGRAALKLAGKFRLEPELARTRHEGELWVDVPIRLPPGGGTGPHVIARPTWVAGFDPDQSLKVFPPEAAARGVTTGQGVARCTVAPGGSLTDCTPERADPPDLGFSEAAVRLASTMKMNPWTVDAAPVNGATVRVGVELRLKP